jgi:tetratricopeptide (TPR) repeat protein
MSGSMLANQVSFSLLRVDIREGFGPSTIRPIRGKLQEAASYHTVGRALLEMAARFGRPETAHAAVEVFRLGLATGTDNPSMQNGLGAALAELAQLETHRSSVVALTEAVEGFQSALGTAKAAGADQVVVQRFEINLIMASWLLAERTGDWEQIDAAAIKLDEILSGRSLGTTPYAQELLGHLRMAHGDPKAAAEAYRLGEKHFKGEDLARLLTNLAAALTNQGKFDEALTNLKRALALQSRDETPLAWGRTQNRIAHILREQAVAQGRSGSVALVERAVEASEEALATHQHIKYSRSGLSIGIEAANAFLALGTRLILAGPTDRQTGIHKIRRATALYKELFPHLSPPDVQLGVNNLKVALELLAQLPGSSENDTVDAISLRLDYFAKNVRYTHRPFNTELIFNSIISGTIPSTMGRDKKQLVQDIEGLLLSSGLPRTEWPRILHAVLRRFDPSAEEIELSDRHQHSHPTAADIGAAATRDSTLVRQWHKYSQLLSVVALPQDGHFKTPEEARLGRNLENTYFRARERQARLGIELIPENDEHIRKIATAASAFYQRRKIGSAEPG